MLRLKCLREFSSTLSLFRSSEVIKTQLSAKFSINILHVSAKHGCVHYVRGFRRNT